MNSQDIHTRSATTTPMSSVRNQEEVAKLVDVLEHIGCKACQVACSEWDELRGGVGHNHGTYDSPTDLTVDSWAVMRFTEHENEVGDPEWLIRKDGCTHCTKLGRPKAYPSPGAIVKYANGIVDFNQDKCIGCGHCITGCPFGIPWVSQKDYKTYKCSLRSNHVPMGVEPVYVKTYPTGVIVFGSKGDIKEHAAEHIVDLKSRGYENAGLYDPEGVDGTYVTCVLHHANRSLFYADLVGQPSVSPLVSLWRDVIKPLVLLAMGVTVFVGFFHYTRIGPNHAGGEESRG